MFRDGLVLVVAALVGAMGLGVAGVSLAVLVAAGQALAAAALP